jgi:hypothetical protein
MLVLILNQNERMYFELYPRSEGKYVGILIASFMESASLSSSTSDEYKAEPENPLFID